MNFIGEHLLYGLLGKSFIWLSFAASLISTAMFLFYFSRKENPLKLIRGIARSFYILHVASLLAVIVVLYILIFKHYFEYSYVWQYSSKTLAIKYIVSCFWAGQEGSFLIWGICQAIIGLFLIRRAGDWESPVMGIVSLSQVFVTSMLLGVSVFSYKIGSNPFTLLRETYAGQPGTIFAQPDYLQYINDGNGLNPLLENIWMTIHPPILFIGYALALIPFAYAIAAFMKKDFRGWIRPSMPWVLLSLTFLGAGILLGGAWAYVSLTFGGFWAWDPVENSSLVPWLTLVAALHFMIVSRRQHFGLLFAFIFSMLSYILVLYATFLTRSGVLSETSAHSFGDNGLTSQLLAYLLVFTGLMLALMTWFGVWPGAGIWLLPVVVLLTLALDLIGPPRMSTPDDLYPTRGDQTLPLSFSMTEPFHVSVLAGRACSAPKLPLPLPAMYTVSLSTTTPFVNSIVAPLTTSEAPLVVPSAALFATISDPALIVVAPV